MAIDRLAQEQFERMCSKMRMAEDALQRALDQLEGDLDPVAWRYVADQVNKAHDWLIDANSIQLASHHGWFPGG